MRTMDASLAELVRAGRITQEMAMDRSHDPDELNRLLGSRSAPPQESFAMGGAMGGGSVSSPVMGGGMGGYSG